MQIVKGHTAEQFYRDVNTLNLRFPVAAIAKATGAGKGNVSRYLNGKLEPGEAFLNKFYEAFGESIKNVAESEKLMTSTPIPKFNDKKEKPDEIVASQQRTIESQETALAQQRDTIQKLATSLAQLTAKLPG